MKKLVFIAIAIALSTMMVSCSKEEQEQCNCGTIANDGIDNGCYWLEIRNDCSGNKKRFCFDEDIWMNNYVGDHFCVTNESSW
jgi:hypothetical protein